MMGKLIGAGALAGLLVGGAALGIALFGAQIQEVTAQEVTAQPDQTFGDWIYQCAEVVAGNPICSLNQTLVDQGSGQPVLKFSLARDAASGKVTLVALLPLGLDFAAGVSGAVDDNTAFLYRLRTCIGTTCIANAEIDAERLTQLKSGSLLKIGFQILSEPAPRVFAGSLNGITAGTKAAGF
jgi:invasion protein IalB